MQLYFTLLATVPSAFVSTLPFSHRVFRDRQWRALAGGQQGWDGDRRRNLLNFDLFYL
jgi:hypothetical protein